MLKTALVCGFVNQEIVPLNILCRLYFFHDIENSNILFQYSLVKLRYLINNTTGITVSNLVLVCNLCSSEFQYLTCFVFFR
jgi:hypothetical protein